jgi:uncharacterized protein (DUF488 family)
MNAEAGPLTSCDGSTEPIPPLYTIGYGSRTMEQFIGALRAHQVAYVIDVRSAPYSKFKPEFSKAALEMALQRQGLRYVFMGDLLGGQPDDRDCYIEGKVDYEKVRTKAFFQAGLDRLKAAYERRLPAALMCSEGRPEQCHRTKLIGEALSSLGIPVTHIDEDGQVRSQTEVIARLTGGQLDLFGAPAFTSRKRYPSGQAGPDHAQG